MSQVCVILPCYFVAAGFFTYHTHTVFLRRTAVLYLERSQNKKNKKIIHPFLTNTQCWCHVPNRAVAFKWYKTPRMLANYSSVIWKCVTEELVWLSVLFGKCILQQDLRFTKLTLRAAAHHILLPMYIHLTACRQFPAAGKTETQQWVKTSPHTQHVSHEELWFIQMQIPAAPSSLFLDTTLH